MGLGRRNTSHWISQSKLPNNMRDKPSIGFKSNLSPEAAEYLRGMNRLGMQSKFINDAIEMKVWFEKYPKGFILNLVRNNFQLCKYLVRKVGRSLS